jgi:hypothetical protein
VKATREMNSLMAEQVNSAASIPTACAGFVCVEAPQHVAWLGQTARQIIFALAL